MNEHIQSDPNVDQNLTSERRREKHVEQDIQRLVKMSVHTREREVMRLSLTLHPSSTNRVAPELLVWSIRHGCRQVSHARDVAAMQLHAWVLITVQRMVVRFGYTSTENERIVGETSTAVLKHILATPDSVDFWECRFWLCVRRIMMTVTKKSSAQRAILGAMSIDSQEGFQLAADPKVTMEEGIELKLALDSLSDQQRNILIWKYQDGILEESTCKDADTIAKRLKCTGRTVRNKLKSIQTDLDNWGEII